MRSLLIFSLLLCACSKAPSPGAVAVSKSGSAALALFDDTKLHGEEAILRLASSALRAGVPLDGPRAERCWREESDRPQVRETCILLWAGRGEGSPELESALLNGRSRLLSLAILQRQPLISRLSWPELLARIESLAQDPLWVRAELAEHWLSVHGSPGLMESEALLSRIRPSEGAGPRDLASSLGAIRRMRAGAWQGVLSSYCDPAAAGESRLRCWRVLGALGSEAERLSALLPSPTDDDWTLFALSFPRFAVRLRAFLR